VRPISTAHEEDVVIILRRAVFAWLIADGDMHLKNLALLKIAEPGDDAFYSVRMAPLYDAVTTRIFPGLKHDRMALKLNGKDDRLNAKDFRSFARTAVERISLPALSAYGPNGRQLVEQMFEIIHLRVMSFA
jgi:serine/threonine-protein kinase HipA